MPKKKIETPEVEAVEVIEAEAVTEVAPEESAEEVAAEPKKPKKEKKVEKDADTEGKKKTGPTPKKFQHGKKYRAIEGLIEKGKEYELIPAIDLLKKTATTKFDSSIEIHANLNVDPTNSEHQIRGSVLMPAGLGKSKKVCAIVSPEKEKEATAAGAEFVGGADLIDKIQKGWLDFEVVVATPDMMAQIGKIGKILGTKGLMPNPKTGTVTADPAKTIAEIKKGRAEYRLDKSGVIHAQVGKVSFKETDIQANIEAFVSALKSAKPSSLKGTYIKSLFLATSMGPGVKLDPKKI
jgi:large subunit ribosomal protein L1